MFRFGCERLKVRPVRRMSCLRSIGLGDECTVVVSGDGGRAQEASVEPCTSQSTSHLPLN